METGPGAHSHGLLSKFNAVVYFTESIIHPIGYIPRVGPTRLIVHIVLPTRVHLFTWYGGVCPKLPRYWACII